MTSLETARSLANGPVCWGKSMYSAFPENGIASPISLLYMGGVCGRSLTPGKILFTGRQRCSLYLALWCLQASTSYRYYPRLFPFQILYILLCEPHALIKESSPQSVDYLLLNQLKEWAERGPKVACIHLTLGRTDLHFKNGIRPCPVTYQWYHRRALSGSDTPIPIYPKLRTLTYPI